jgi:hypothetical protein
MITAIVLMMVFLVASEIYAANESKPIKSSKKKEPEEKKPSTINWRVVRYILFIICIALLASLTK